MAYKPKGKVKALTGAILKYREKVKQAGVHIPELEAVSKFIGKKGQILKRATRSKKSQERLEEAIAAAKEKFGARPSQKKIAAELEERKEEAAERKAKAKKTYRERKKKEAAASGKKVNFRSIAQKASRSYEKVLDVMMDASLKKMMDSYGIGSDVVEYLAEQGLTTKQIWEFLEQLIETLDDLPEEALPYANMDIFFGTLQEVKNTYKDQEWDDITEMFTLAISHPNSMDEVHEIIGLWQEAGGSGVMSFADFRKELEENINPLNMETAREILGLEEDE